MAQTPKLRTHTDFDLEHLEELQHVVDRVLLPNSFRKRQAMNMGVGVMAGARRTVSSVGHAMEIIMPVSTVIPGMLMMIRTAGIATAETVTAEIATTAVLRATVLPAVVPPAARPLRRPSASSRPWKGNRAARSATTRAAVRPISRRIPTRLVYRHQRRFLYHSYRIGLNNLLLKEMSLQATDSPA